MIETYAIDLPGKSLYTIPFNVKIRKITPVEIKYAASLFQKQEADIKEYIDFISKLVEFDNPEMKFEDLYWFDLQYILYQIRHRTFSKYPIKLQFNCNNELENGEICQNTIIQNLDIGALSILQPTDIEGFTNKIQLENLGEVVIHNHFVKDDKLALDFIKANKLNEKELDTVVFISDLIAVSSNYSLEEMYKFATDGTLTAQDIIAIENWLEKNVWGVKEEVTVKCPECGKEELRHYTLSLGDYFSVIRHE